MNLTRPIKAGSLSSLGIIRLHGRPLLLCSLVMLRWPRVQKPWFSERKKKENDEIVGLAFPF